MILKPWDAATLAERLDGREYLDEITREEEQIARENGLLVLFGRSDDLIELRGLFDDDVPAFYGTTFRVDRLGVRKEWRDIDHRDEAEARRYFERERFESLQVVAEWDCGGFSWWINAENAHDEFHIFEDGQPFCRGLVVDCSKLLEEQGAA